MVPISSCTYVVIKTITYYIDSDVCTSSTAYYVIDHAGMHSSVVGMEVRCGDTSNDASPGETGPSASGAPLVEQSTSVLHTFHLTGEGESTGSSVGRWGQGER